MPHTDHPFIGKFCMNNKDSIPFHKNRVIYLILLVLSAIILAPFVWNQISSFIVKPVSYFWWMVKQFIRVVPQTYYWIFLIGSLGIVSFVFLLLYLQKPQKEHQKYPHVKGPIKSLAEFVILSEKSYYFKWVIANRLAQITQEILDMNQGNSNGDHYTFSDIDCDMPEIITDYLEAGMDNTHMSYKPRKLLRGFRKKSPLDVELNRIISYLESQLE